MTSVSLQDIKNICDNKKIALVGNSSKILNKQDGNVIDLFDIVIRLNHSIPVLDKLYTGLKTDIYFPNMSTKTVAYTYSKMSNAKFILQLTRWNNELNERELYLIKKMNNVYIGDMMEFKVLNNKLKDFIPSTGLVTYNFIINNLNFKELSLFGFDFFKSSNKFKSNKFKSFLYKSHSSIEEQIYKDLLINNIYFV
jgi:hypothetical protein